MSVLIKGMEKPKSCTWRDGRCPLLGDDDDCKLQDCQEEWTWQDQYKGCPLSDAPDTNVGTISRQAAPDALEKCYTCKHVYQSVNGADTLFYRCRRGCKYEEFKPKRSTGNSQ